MTPFASALTHWAESFANGTARLDPLTRARLRAVSGHVIEIVIDPPGETVWMRIDGESIRLHDEPLDCVTVRVCGSPGAIAATLFGFEGLPAKLDIDGDDAILSELRSIVRNFRPDGVPPLQDLVGARTMQAITSLIEVGSSALASLGREVRDEGRRLTRDAIGQRYLSAPEFDRYLESLQRLRIRVDRLTVRTGLVESAKSGGRE
jgi:ubiquinone biosynthesis protein UbiJ